VDDPLQWILQRRKGNPRDKNTGWQSRSFCRTREALLRCIREYCCSPDAGGVRCIHEYHGVDGAALQQVRALPEWHVDWSGDVDRAAVAALPQHHAMQNLDVRGTDQAQADEQPEPLVSQGFEETEAEHDKPCTSQFALP
jgi:hypothetical protein